MSKKPVPSPAERMEILTREEFETRVKDHAGCCESAPLRHDATLRAELQKADEENKRLRSVIENGCSENVACQKCASGAATARSLCDKCFSAGMEFGHAHPEYTPEKKP
jgi:hypothetical protein